MKRLLAATTLVNLICCADPTNPNHTIDPYIQDLTKAVVCFSETEEPVVSERMAFDGFIYIGTVRSFDMEGRQTVVALQYEDYGANPECSDPDYFFDAEYCGPASQDGIINTNDVLTSNIYDVQYSFTSGIGFPMEQYIDLHLDRLSNNFVLEREGMVMASAADVGLMTEYDPYFVDNSQYLRQLLPELYLQRLDQIVEAFIEENPETTCFDALN